MGGAHSRRSRAKGKIVKCQSFEEFIRKGKPGEGNPSYNIQLDNDQVRVSTCCIVHTRARGSVQQHKLLGIKDSQIYRDARGKSGPECTLFY